jgi:hypothetical protein
MTKIQSLAIAAALNITLLVRPAQAQPGAANVCPGSAFDAKTWLDDFDQLRAEMSGHYSDLDYAVEGRHMDLPALRRETETKLRNSCNEGEARKALESFLNSFGDGHLQIEWPKAPSQLSATSSSDTSALCGRLGYKKPEWKPGIDFALLPQFQNIGGEGSEQFPGGILRVNEKTNLGVIRIPIFREQQYLSFCQQVVQEMHLLETESCDSECETKITTEISNRLIATIAKRSALLGAAGASAILVDLTHNDGGSDWADAVVRTLSPTPLREADWGFIKHEHWTKELQDRLSDAEADLKNGRGSDDILRKAATRLQSGIARSQEKCDSTSVWDDNRLTCSLVVSGLLYSTGILPYATPGSFAQLQSRTVLFRPLRYVYTESTARLPLYVAVDAHTWSSAEYFAFLLQDNAAATILGQVTGGAGCGFNNGVIPTTLKNSHARVKMPDCVHFRKDGSNANAGVTPDTLVPWSAHDSEYIRAQKLFDALLRVAALASDEGDHGTHQ